MGVIPNLIQFCFYANLLFNIICRNFHTNKSELSHSVFQKVFNM